MSYYTRLAIEWDDSNEHQPVDEDSLVERARLYVHEQDISVDILADLRDALGGCTNDGVGFNRMSSDEIIDLIRFVSRGFPNTCFFARGAGEEMLDLWIREFKNGEVTRAHGPWSE